MSGAHCESDHNPVISTVRIRLQKIKRAKNQVAYDTNGLKKADKRDTFRSRLDTRIEEKEIDRYDEIDTIWNKLRESLEWIADEVCGKEQRTKNKIG